MYDSQVLKVIKLEFQQQQHAQLNTALGNTRLQNFLVVPARKLLSSQRCRTCRQSGYSPWNRVFFIHTFTFIFHGKMEQVLDISSYDSVTLWTFCSWTSSKGPSAHNNSLYYLQRLNGLHVSWQSPICRPLFLYRCCNPFSASLFLSSYSNVPSSTITTLLKDYYHDALRLLHIVKTLAIRGFLYTC